MAARTAPVLVLRHVDWEGPHRIADALPSRERRLVDVLQGAELPDPAGVAGAVVMGGPMTSTTSLATLTSAASAAGSSGRSRNVCPCSGSASAPSSSRGRSGRGCERGEPRSGSSRSAVSRPDDPVVGGLAPRSVVLHWHRDVFDLPRGAELLARSARTECQGFRYGDAWGLLFQAEADAALLERWLAVDEMRHDAQRELGRDAADTLRSAARVHEGDLVRRSAAGFAAFGRLLERRRRTLGQAS